MKNARHILDQLLHPPKWVLLALPPIAFAALIHVKYRKLGSPILSAAKILNLIAALMSLLGLQTAMISQFSPERENFRKIMNAVTGGGVWCSVILIAVTMLLRSRKMKEVKPVDPLGE